MRSQGLATLATLVTVAALGALTALAACSGSGAADAPSALPDAPAPPASGSSDAPPSPDGAAPMDGGQPAHPAPLVTLADVAGLSAGPVGCAGASCDAKRAAFFALLGDLGIHKIRTDLRWSDVEPKRGTFDFSGTDRIVGAARAAGVEVLGILDYGASWATTHNDALYPPDHLDDFVTFATTLATHYDGQVSEYEVWNEPNAGFSFWKSSFGGDAKVWGDLTKRTADALRKLPLKTPVTIAPGGTVYLSQLVPILPPGIIPAGTDFARDAFAQNPGLAASTNAFAFHGYDSYPPRNAPESAALGEVQLGTKIESTRAMLKNAGAGARPLWLTEIGWPTANGVDEAAQARWSVRSLLLGALGGLDAIYLYTLYDGDSPPAFSFAPEGSFGLAHADGTAKASFRAVKGLLAVLGKMTVVGRAKPAGAPGDVYVVELAGAAGEHGYAAWRSDDGQGPWAWKLPTGFIGTAHAIDGKSLGKVGVEVSVTRDPVYVVEGVN